MPRQGAKIQIACSGLIQGSPGSGPCEIGGIVMLAEMAEEEILQARMPDPSDGIGALVIAQMPVSLANSHFQFVGIGSAHQHIHIII